jgi:hypothetical protein
MGTMDIRKERLIKQCQIALGEFDEDFIYEDVDFSTPSSIQKAYKIYERRGNNIACVKCDEVNTVKAWQKNGGICPEKKCNSSQGVFESTLDEKQLAGLKKKADASGISYGILKKVFDRGMAAWKTGHRPGATPHQWAYARVNSFITGGKTRTTADADLWAKHKGKKESVELEEDAKCPTATQDLEVNTTNRDATIKKFNYGPLNVDEPGSYWKDIAKYWKTTEEAAKKSLCENCVAFDISPRMKDCMPGKTSDKDGELGYCWMHHFKCHSARSCHTWAKGGPITDDETSYDWQERSKI